jgi:hypothetical protein
MKSPRQRAAPSGPRAQDLSGCWIWDDSPPRAYNASRWFRAEWEAGGGQPAQLAITADSRYRLWVNGTWLGDGPVRGWPEGWFADLIDLTPHLRPGRNEILVLVQFYGCGTFHIIPQRGGLSAILYEGGREVLRTCSAWQVRPAAEYPEDVPRISVQLPAMEVMDARLSGTGEWRPALRLAGNAPWRMAGWRDVAPPATSEFIAPGRPVARFVRSRPTISAIPLLGLLHPGVFTQAVRMTRPLALAAEVEVTGAATHAWFDHEAWEVHVDGVKVNPAKWRPKRGRHRVVAAYTRFCDDRVDTTFGFPQHPSLRWMRSSSAPQESQDAWVAMTAPELLLQGDDHLWIGHPSRYVDDLTTRYRAWCASCGAATGKESDFSTLVSGSAAPPGKVPLLCDDPDALFRARETVARTRVAPARRAGWKVPARAGCDTELHFDLGDQRAGFQFVEVEAPAGTVVDGNLVEFIRADGVVQHTTANRNGFRFICPGGRVRFLSRQRRSGRHLFLTFRGAGKSLRLISAGVVESLYPAVCARDFSCSDAELTRIWRAADRTMRLSMDDVYIDSLYEQTLWVGDARSEQLYALRTHDARDISLRSLRLAAASLARGPMVLSQVPSCWTNIIPVWSFLWVIAVWEYYDYGGDAAALRELWPAVRQNLRAASYQLNDRALFDAPWWNLFEWADVDNNERVVLYNSLFFLGAVQAARRMEQVVWDPEEGGWLASLEDRLRWGIETLWDAEKGLYAESLDRDGKPSRRFSIHPQFLAALYGAAPPARAASLLARVARPHKSLEGLASAFALQFQCEALDAAGRRGEILDLMRHYFAPMVQEGTTLWEALPGSKTTPPGFPTRSHCHGWSACPLDFLPLIVLGIRQDAPGGRRFIVSPEPHGLRAAEGSRATPHGPILVRWQLERGLLRLEVRHPASCTVEFRPNPQIAELRHEVRISEAPDRD